MEFDENGLRIIKEGRFQKLVNKVQQISYNGKLACERGQNMFYVTERAVFRLTENGPELIEIAKGLDLEKDILAHMEFKPLIAENLKEIPIEIYLDQPYGLKKLLDGRR